MAKNMYLTLIDLTANKMTKFVAGVLFLAPGEYYLFHPCLDGIFKDGFGEKVPYSDRLWYNDGDGVAVICGGSCC